MVCLPQAGELRLGRVRCYKHRALPVSWVLLLLWFARRGLFGLCLLFFTEFGVTGFPAVGDLGQELADVFDFGLGPRVHDKFAELDNFWSGHLPNCDVVAQSLGPDAQFFSGLPRGYHSFSIVLDSYG